MSKTLASAKMSSLKDKIAAKDTKKADGIIAKAVKALKKK